jgi:hypothetical protein
MMGDSRLDQKKLKELREYITRLSLLQRQLRTLLQQYIDQTGDSAHTVAQKTHSTWATVSGLLEAERVVKKDIIVGNLAGLLGMSDESAQEIVVLGKKIPDRYLGLAAFNHKVIDIVFDLMVAHNAVSQEYSMAEFAKAFAQYEQTVLGALSLLRNALVEIQTAPGVIDGILEILLNDALLERKLKEIKEAQTRRRLAAIAEIDQQVAKLLPRYDDKVSLVKDLGLSRGSLDRAKLIGASDAQVDRFLSILEATAHKQSSVRKVKTRAERRKKIPLVADSSSATSTEVPSADPFHGLVGSTIQGVPYVLTADNFREIEGVAAKAVIDALVISMRTTIGLFGVVAQMKGDEIHRMMRMPKVDLMRRALYEAQQIAESSDPTPLLKMFDEERRMREINNPFGQNRKGGTKRG